MGFHVRAYTSCSRVLVEWGDRLFQRLVQGYVGLFSLDIPGCYVEPYIQGAGAIALCGSQIARS